MERTSLQDYGAHRCKQEVKLEPNALDIISEIIDRLRSGGSGGCLCPQEDWMNGIRVHEPIQLNHDAVRAKQDMMGARRLEDLAGPLALAGEALQKIQECVSQQAEDCKFQARALRMRAGFALLPDEILAAVLEYALIDQDSHIGIYDEYGPSILHIFRSLGRLSLACRRFRYLLTHLSNIWCRLWSGMDARLVSTLCKRLEKPVAEILISRNDRGDKEGSDLQSFVNDVVARAEFWSRFNFSRYSADAATLSQEIHCLARTTNRLSLPFLTRLTVAYPPGTFLSEIKEDDDHYYFSSWSTPRLTSFNISNLIPRPLAASSTLTSFGINLHWTRVSERTPDILKALALFLESCLDLVTFAMHISSLNSTTGTHIPDLGISQPAILPSVKYLGLDIVACEASLVTSFFGIVQFPNVSAMSLHISCLNDPSPAQDLLNSVFYQRPTTHNSSFASLETLALEMTCVESRQHATFPYATLKNLRHLTLSLSNVTFRDSPLPSDSEPCLPSLISLTFKSCRDLDRGWVRGFLGRLKRQGNVPQLRVNDCHWNEEEEENRELNETDANDGEETSSSADGDERGDGDGEPAVVTEEDLLAMVS